MFAVSDIFPFSKHKEASGSTLMSGPLVLAPRRSFAGFTLVELLIVIGILAVLGTAAVIVINPAELMKQTRDATRITDLQTLNKALSMYEADGGSSFGTANVIYLSLPDANANCSSYTLPTLPGGWSYACKPTTSYRSTDGSGWLPVNLGSIASGSPLSTLPIDPVNDGQNGNYYTYVGGSWELTSKMESNKYRSTQATKDNGTSIASFEIGPDLLLTPAIVEESGRDDSLSGYWAFDEDTGSTALDSSGHGNNGTLMNSPSWTTGKIGNALSFDGINDYVEISSTGGLNPGANDLTVTAWFKEGTVGNLNGSIIYNKENLYEASAGGGYFTYAWQPHWAWDGGSSFSTNIDEWYHVAVVYDHAKQYIYRNGTLLYQRAQTGNMNTNTSALRIGARGAPGGASSFFNGIIDDVRVYTRALTPDEISALYTAGE